MAAGMVMLVITANVACHQPLNPFIQLVGLTWLYEKMKMIGHQAPCVKQDLEFLPCLLQQVDEGLVITIFMKDLLSAVTPIDNVVAGIVR